MHHSMSDFGKRGKRGTGEQEGEPGGWWLLEKDLAEISLSHRSAYILKVSSQSSQKLPINLYFPPKNRLTAQKMSSVHYEFSLICHSPPLKYIQSYS